MVEIQCPHCEADVLLDDGADGLFDCPYCEEEFEWNIESEEIFEDKTNLEATQPGFLVNIPGLHSERCWGVLLFSREG